MPTATNAPPVVIRSASVLDGSGADPVVADVRTAGGVIERIAPGITPVEGDEVVDAGGLTLAPGFVDLHSHSDLYTVQPVDAGAPVGDEPKLIQGCTVQVFGQDGLSAAPVREDDLDDFRRSIAGLDGDIDRSLWTWRSFGEYLAAVRRGSTTRAAGLVGHSTLRRFVMGMDNRPPTLDELSEMQAVLAESLDAGAAGISTGLVYVPAAFADTDELVALCEVAAARGKPFFVHVRSESEHLLEATDEVIEVAQRSGVHLHYSHIKAAGKRNWDKAGELVERLQHAADSGVKLTADLHPYIAGSSTATVLVPPWALEGGPDAALRRLSDTAVRDRIRTQLLTDVDTWDNWYDFSSGWGGIRIAGARRPGVLGKSFARFIQDEGVEDLTSPAAFDLVFDLLVEEQLGVTLISFNGLEDNVMKFFSQPYVGVGSDGVVNPDGLPHPRLYGTFGRVLGRLVREHGVVDLAEAVRRMTSHAARIVGLGDTAGTLAVGRPADLVLFDANTVLDRATYEEPRLAPIGVHRVWLGGRTVARNGVIEPTVAAAAR